MSYYVVFIAYLFSTSFISIGDFTMSDNPTNPQPLSKAEFGSKINRTVRTLERWDEKGVFKARRTATNAPYYLPEDVDRFLGGVDPEDLIAQQS